MMPGSSGGACPPRFCTQTRRCFNMRCCHMMYRNRPAIRDTATCCVMKPINKLNRIKPENRQISSHIYAHPLPHRKPVSHAADSLNEFVEGKRFKGLAQAPDVYIHRALLDIDAFPPYMIQQLRASVNPFRVGDEKMQQPDFRRADR